jgi:hypothetical protein
MNVTTLRWRRRLDEVDRLKARGCLLAREHQANACIAERARRGAVGWQTDLRSDPLKNVRG